MIIEENEGRCTIYNTTRRVTMHYYRVLLNETFLFGISFNLFQFIRNCEASGYLAPCPSSNLHTKTSNISSTLVLGNNNKNSPGMKDPK